MRSFIKIGLGVEFIVSLFIAVISFALSISMVANATYFIELIKASAPDITASDIRLLSLIFVGIMIFSILSAIFIFYTDKKMNKASSKKEMIIPIILMFVTLNFIHALLLKSVNLFEWHIFGLNGGQIIKAMQNII